MTRPEQPAPSALDRIVSWAIAGIAVLMVLTGLAGAARGAPPQCATILVRVDKSGRVIDRRAGSDSFSSLRHLGWIRAIRPPGVCIRTALLDGIPAWLDWGEHPWFARAYYPHGPWPVVWDARGLAIYLKRHGSRGPVPLPLEVDEIAARERRHQRWLLELDKKIRADVERIKEREGRS